MLSYVLGTIPLVLFYCLIGITIRCCFTRSLAILKTVKFQWIILFISLTLLAGTGFVAYLICQNHFVYYWDYGAYWTWSIDQMNRLFADPFQAFAFVYDSINTQEYNWLLPSLISVPLKIFGYDFPNYVILNFVLFLFPAMLIQGLCCLEIFLQKSKSVLIFCVMAFLFPCSYYAMLKGYIDVAELILSSLLIGCIIHFDFTKNNPKADLCIAINLVLVLLMRRYFAYFVVGYVLIMFYFALVQCVQQRFSWSSIKSAILHFTLIGGVSLSILFLFFREFFLRSLTTNYAAQYVAYDLPWPDKIHRFISYYGLFQITLCVLAVLFSLINKKKRVITIGLFLFVLIPPLLFLQVQRMDIHHYYIICTQVFFLGCLGIYQFAKYLGSIHKPLKSIAFIGLAMLYGLCFLFTYTPAIQNLWGANHFITNIMPAIYEPFYRNDMDQLYAMKDYLNTLSKENNDAKIYVAASGEVLNSDILTSLEKPYKAFAVENLRRSCDIDLRDGFPADFLTSDIVVTTDPVQLHAAPNTQEVVSFLAQEVSNPNSPIGRHYQATRSFELDNDVTATVYLRLTPFEESDYQYLADYYTSIYPDYPELFADRIWSVFNDSSAKSAGES